MIILGAGGMLGRAFCKLYGNTCVPLTREDCDFSDFRKLEKLLDSTPFLPIVNCAAKVDISYVEDNYDECFRVNVLLPIFLAKYSRDNQRKLVQISTDHYFVDSYLKHDESSHVTLINSYAEQKYLAESAIRYYNKGALIVRTSILGYRGGQKKTLLEWILYTLKTQGEIKGFTDAITSSIDVDNLALLVELSLNRDLCGVYNICAHEPYSKFELISQCIKSTGSRCHLNASSVSELETARAHSCGLDPSKIEKELGVSMPTLRDILDNLNIKERYDEI